VGCTGKDIQRGERLVRKVAVEFAPRMMGNKWDNLASCVILKGLTYRTSGEGRII
jgi:hypothetical protein